MREARPIVISFRRQKNLGLVFEAPEGLGVNDAVAVTLERGPDGVFGFGALPSLARGAFARRWGKDLPLALFESFSNGHGALC
jgi:hypothetical protein